MKVLVEGSLHSNHSPADGGKEGGSSGSAEAHKYSCSCGQEEKIISSRPEDILLKQLTFF
jgi:hypothetical protein